jgi:hypothetical protein
VLAGWAASPPSGVTIRWAVVIPGRNLNNIAEQTVDHTAAFPTPNDYKFNAK